jgi:hypothetical protein
VLPPLPDTDLPADADNDADADGDGVGAGTGAGEDADLAASKRSMAQSRLLRFTDPSNTQNLLLPPPPASAPPSAVASARLTLQQLLLALRDAERAVARDDALHLTRLLLRLCGSGSDARDDASWLSSHLHPQAAGRIASHVTLRDSKNAPVRMSVRSEDEAAALLGDLLACDIPRQYPGSPDHVIVDAVKTLTRPVGAWCVEDEEDEVDEEEEMEEDYVDEEMGMLPEPIQMHAVDIDVLGMLQEEDC